MKNKLHKILFYTLLLAVYGIFFSVESFFNFEGQTNARDIFRLATLTNPLASQDLHAARTTPLHSSSSHNIRLNKRFHQEDMPPCPVLSPAAPVCYVLPIDLSIYHDTFHPSFTLPPYPLRGPPPTA